VMRWIMLERAGREVIGNRREYIRIAETGPVEGMRMITRPGSGRQHQ